MESDRHQRFFIRLAGLREFFFGADDLVRFRECLAACPSLKPPKPSATIAAMLTICGSPSASFSHVLPSFRE
jgi:hypothetical protein